MKIFGENFAAGVGAEKKESNESNGFCGEGLNEYFQIPEHLSESGIEDGEISHPFLIPSDYDGIGGGFKVRKEFFESRYYSQEGLLWILDYLQNVQDERMAEEEFTEKLTEEDGFVDDEYEGFEGGWKDDFWEMNDHDDNILDDSEVKEGYDCDLSLQRDFVLDNLARVETDRKTVDKLVDFLQKDFKSHVYTTEIANALNHADPNYASSRLLGLMRDKKTVEEMHSGYKGDIAKIIYRLEFGKINISEEGLRYLEKTYDLVEMNNPEYFANRLTARGDVGIFDQDGVLQSYINVDDSIAEDVVHVRPEILDFTYETLFFGSKNETPEERMSREEMLQEFKEGYFSFYNDAFVERTGVRFNNLDFKEQGAFLSYYKKADDHKKEDLMNFISKHEENGLRSFLSLEHGGQEMGEKILKIGETLSQLDVRRIFKKYVALVDAAGGVESYISEQFESEEDVNTREIAEKLLVRGKKLLELVADNLEMSEESLQKILQKIDAVKSDVELFKATVKNVREQGGSLDQMKDLQTMTLKGKEIAGDEKMVQKMKDMYSANYEEYPKLQSLLVDSIDKKIASPDTQFHFSIHKEEATGEKVISFLTTKRQKDGSIYFGSFNTDNEVFGGASLGFSLAEEVFARSEQEGVKKIEAHSVPEEGVNSVYMNRYGFVADGLVENYEDTEADLFHIVREEKNKEYYFQGEVNNDELKSLIVDSAKEIDESAEKFIVKLKKGENITQLSKQLFEKGYVLTRYDLDRETGEVHCGFEREVKE